MKILHIVREMEMRRVLDVAEQQAQQGHQANLLLLHDAVLAPPRCHGIVYVCEVDAQARSVSSLDTLVSYDEIVRLLFEHDRVISW